MSTSLQRVIRLLEYFSATDSGLRFGDIKDICNGSSASASRLLKTLANHGIVQHHGDLYTPGPRLVAFARGISFQHVQASLSQHQISSLAQALDASFPDFHQAVLVVESAQSVRAAHVVKHPETPNIFDAQRQYPALKNTPFGWIMLAKYADPNQALRFGRKQTVPTLIQRELQRLDTDGWLMNDGDFLRHVWAAPIYNTIGDVTAILSITAMTNDIDDAISIGHQLANVAQQNIIDHASNQTSSGTRTAMASST